MATTKALSTNEESTLKIVAALEQLAGATRGHESVQRGIRDHAETFYIKPEVRSYAEMAEIAIAAAKEEQETARYQNTFSYRPWDGAHATALALKELFGYPGFGMKIPATFFSPEVPPQSITIATGPNTKVEVPWGMMIVPDLDATLSLGAIQDREKGMLYHLTVDAPKKMEGAIRGLFVLIERALKEHSIYKGKAITGAMEPEFLDLSGLRPEEVIFRSTVQDALEHEVWFAIENYELMLKDRQPTKWVTLCAGDYGTGKTLATSLTALRCEKNGITFIQARPGQDDLKSVMQTAALYSPAVVAFEDVDTIADPTKADATEISRLLEAFDGIRSKGADVQVIMTTNNQDRIHAGLVRAGRLHTYIVFEDLDAEALMHLVEIKVGKARLADIDPEEVYAACHGYTPAFMDLVIQVARRYALSRNHKRLLEGDQLTRKDGSSAPSEQEILDYRIATADLVSAALRLRPQYDLMTGARDKEPINNLDRQFRSVIGNLLDSAAIVDEDGDPWNGLSLKVNGS